MSDHNEYTRQAASTMRICLVCHKAIEELRKASYLDAGNGLRLVMHDRCLEALQEAKQEQDMRASARVATDQLAKQVSRRYMQSLEQKSRTDSQGIDEMLGEIDEMLEKL